MSILTYQLTPGGLLALPPAATLAAASAALPPGVYTTFRTYRRFGVVRLEQHLARLERSGALLGHGVELPRAPVRAGLRAALAEGGHADSRVRLTLALEPPHALFVTVEPLAPPDDRLYREGAHAACVELARERPRAKSTAFISVADRLYARRPPGVYEWLLVSGGVILEGLTSNFFGVRDGALYTAGEGVLEGVTRALVLEVARVRGVSVRFEPVARAALGELDEACITSSSREVVPVVQVDAVRIGAGVPGPVTRGLLDGYREMVSRECELL